MESNPKLKKSVVKYFISQFELPTHINRWSSTRSLCCLVVAATISMHLFYWGSLVCAFIHSSPCCFCWSHPRLALFGAVEFALDATRSVKRGQGCKEQ
ncbi:hypothetical protein PVAP13_2NG047975 [Panicum virgatum]|uniref:Uncharacterized protein n=1 Tax=Panicum virgatum TaxID=38727 RepID=A0A8T0V516_PANVG|nr:hypothetical protein PVAP13_2NG047975 [Panicum virgatum]